MTVDQRAFTELRRMIRETRQEMKAKGIRRISCFNGGLLGEVYSLNARMFQLESQLKDVKLRMAGKEVAA